MEILSTTVEYKGMSVKIENGKVFLRSFGTTIYNHSMHWSWCEVPIDRLKDELVRDLKSQNLI